MGSLISLAHRERVHGFVEQGRERGRRGRARRRAGGRAGRVLPADRARAAWTTRWRVAQEEIFGPVVTVIPFEDEADAIRIANDVRYGLMATVWTGDPARGHRIAREIKSGTVGINMPYTAFPGIPFGGYKQSGFGRELALETLDLYLETKSVIVNTGSRSRSTPSGSRAEGDSRARSRRQPAAGPRVCPAGVAGFAGGASSTATL